MEEELYLLGSSLEDSSVKDEQLTFLNTNAASSVESEAAVGNAVYLLPSFYNRNWFLFYISSCICLDFFVYECFLVVC
ncbi:hypothetical protein HanRHA438_Chr14g0655781 [Helianthus annuus]|nr:hypothetical protein HanHA300_Chr14g0524941 [Helianthus annuus]KAJ0468712.1 hypothetical protein HanIR_Chr14g0699781 [Helianthus annuus]KAJ0660008.1 hypothetical protein HanOQP8_Chr14g0532801 [Helianthus annuus]KAJ0853832.1 hypothetical protein HanRHA438_Chr14g0655781 [Helianthus annuus]